MVMAPRPMRETSSPPRDTCFIRYSVSKLLSDGPPGRGGCAWQRVSVRLGRRLQDEDRDLTVRVLLVLRVGRERLDGSGPPHGLLVPGHLACQHVPAHRAVLQLDPG